MDNYKLVIKPLTPFASEIQSDTLFGQVLWIIKYTKDEKFFNDILHKIKNKEKFLIFSSAFHNEFLELPTIPLTIEEENDLRQLFFEKINSIGYVNNDNLKKIKDDPEFGFYLYKKKTKKEKLYIKFEDIKNEINLEKLKPVKNEENIDSFLESFINNKDKNRKIKKDVIMRNVINRITWTTKEDSLFYNENYFFSENFKYYIYIKTNLFSYNELKEIFENLGKFGYGADTSIGKGQFLVESLEKINIEERNDTNYILSLSNYIPEEDEVDLNNSFYSVFLKKGKLGCDYALGIDNKEKSFFKTPLIMIKDIALLKIKKQKEIYGILVDNINYANKDIIHNGQAFTIRLKINLNGG